MDDVTPNEPIEPIEPAQPAEPTAFIDKDGNFTDGWLDNYVPEDVRGDAIFSRIKTIQGMAKSLANFDRMKGADTIVKPSDKFGDDDWDAYYTAGGWTGQPIEITAPEGLADGIWSDERAKLFSEGFNKLRLNPKQVAGIIEMYNSDLMQQVTNADNDAETAMAELKAGLLSDWGNAYAQKEHLANFTVEKGTKGDAEFKERILKKFGNDPDFIRYNANIGGDFSESGSAPTIIVKDTPADIDAKISAIRDSDAYNKPLHPEHKTAMANLQRLYKEKVNVRVPA